MYVRRLIWDPWNVIHIARHGITPEEAEQACHGRHITLATHHDRLLLLGVTAGGRTIILILHPEGDDIYYAVTARPASRKERAFYQTNVTGGDDAEDDSQ